MPLTPFREPKFTSRMGAPRRPVSVKAPTLPLEKEALMVPLLLWILGVPGLIIILLLLLGVINF
jgi:hypothetical protein